VRFIGKKKRKKKVWTFGELINKGKYQRERKIESKRKL